MRLGFLASNSNRFQYQIFGFLCRSDKSGKKRNKFFRKERVESSKG